MDLIPMTEYLLNIRGMTTSELCKEMPQHFVLPVWNGDKDEMVKKILALDCIKWRLVGEYAKFLKTPLKLGHFIPCDLDGKVLEETWKSNSIDYRNPPPDDYMLDERMEYQKAKKRVLFEGLKFKYYSDNKSTCLYLKSKLIFTHYSLIPRTDFQLKRIENLTRFGLKIKPNQVNSLGI